MLSKIISRALLLVPFLFSQASAVFTDVSVHERVGGGITVRATWVGGRRLTFVSATPEMKEDYRATLQNLGFHPGYPAVANADTAFQGQNLARQAAKNPFHLYSVSVGGEEIPPTFVQCGRMPTKKYAEGLPTHPTAHHPIIEHWIEMGITKKKDPEGGLGDDNIERIENRGLATFIPLFRAGITDASLKEEVIDASYHFLRELMTRGFFLPVENTVPHAVVGLVHPQDPILPCYGARGFTLVENDGFGWFYPTQEEPPQPQRRVMVTCPLPMGAAAQ